MSKCADMLALTELIHDENYVCEICVETGDDWVHLRICQTCGATLCCDDSPNKHITAHYHATKHPVIISAEPGEKWMWCYDHESFSPYR